VGESKEWKREQETAQKSVREAEIDRLKEGVERDRESYTLKVWEKWKR